MNRIYKNDLFIVFGELLVGDKVPRNGYGCKIRQGYTLSSNYDLYTLSFNNDYGSNGISSVTIPYEYYDSDTYTARVTMGIGWDYNNKQLFFHINPKLYGDGYGLAIPVSSFPKNTRLYILTVDVDKDDTTTNPTTITINAKRDKFVYTSVANNYLGTTSI